nr:pyridoxal-phosphate dependent enzyme [Ktedonosporobacter rubrisoli]
MRLIENDPLAETHSEVFNTPVTIADVWQAYKFLKPLLHHTALTPSRTFYQMTGADIYLKAEHMQRGGSFKVRGAGYKIHRLTDEQRKAGVIAASAGNHAQGVAIAAAQHNIPCTIVMPENAPWPR